ncbi:MAG: ATP-binding protein [Zestosphaera sp.]
MSRKLRDAKVLWSNLYRDVKNLFVAYAPYRESYVSYRLLATLSKHYNYLENIDNLDFAYYLKIRSRVPVRDGDISFSLIPLSLNVFSKIVSRRKFYGILGLVLGGFRRAEMLSASITTAEGKDLEGLRPVIILVSPDEDDEKIKSRISEVVTGFWVRLVDDLRKQRVDITPYEILPPLSVISLRSVEHNELRVIVSDGNEYRDIRIPIRKPSWTMSDLPQKLIDEINVVLVNPIFKELPFSVRGAFITGPPGVGKTVMAEALASALNLNVIELRPQSYRSMWYGATEKALNAIFQQIFKQRGKVALVIDDAEFISSRKYTIHEAHISEISTILYHLQRPERPFTILTANNPDLIDPALLRPGRIDIAIILGYPDKEMRRKAILNNARRYSIKFTDDAIPDRIVELSKWFSLAELDALLRLSASKGEGTVSSNEVEWAKKRFTISVDERKSIQEYLRWWARKFQGIVISYLPMDSEI